MARRNERPKTNGAFTASMPDEPMVVTNGVDITATVLSVTYVKLMEPFEASEIARLVLKGMMEAARSKREGETSNFVVFEEFQEVAKSDTP